MIRLVTNGCWLAKTDSKVIVDLSIPHNIDKDIPTGFPVQYIEIEGLRSVAQENLEHRTRACAQAEGLIRQRIYGFRELWHERQVERALSHIPEEIHAVKQKAIEEVFSKEFAQLDEQAKQTVLRMLDYMEKKCVGIPMKAAKAVVLHAKKQREAVDGLIS